MSNPLTLIPARVRALAYLVLFLLGPVVVYAAAKGWIGDLEVALYAGYSALVGGTALSNTPTADH